MSKNLKKAWSSKNNKTDSYIVLTAIILVILAIFQSIIIWSISSFLATMGDLYELLCHRGRRLLRLGEGGGRWCKITFWLDNWIPFILFAQKLAWIWYLTLIETSLQNIFDFLKIHVRGLRSKVPNRPDLTP